MQSHRPPSAPAGGLGSAGVAIRVPAPADPGANVAELSHLTQAERATRALAESRRERQIPVELALLQSALDLRQTLRVIVSAAVPGFADWCFVDLVDREGVARRVEVAHADPAKAPLAHDMRSISQGPGWATPSAHAIRDRAPRLFRGLSDELMEWVTHDERHLALLRAIQPSSLAAIPLVARDRTVGAITVIRSTTQPGFVEEDLAYLAALAAPAALALDNIRWYDGERTARMAAQEEADRERDARYQAERSVLRLRRLESVASTLAGALAPQAIARFAVETGLAALDFSSATVVRATTAGFLDVLHTQGWPDDLARELRSLPLDASALVAEAYRTQTAIWLASPGALDERYPSARELPRRLGDQAWAALPLRVDGKTLGSIGLGFPRPRELDADERRYLLSLAQLVAQALERSRLRDLEGALGMR
jgi:GAF domain-containing protein